MDILFIYLAEREGFEPPVPFSTSVFKTDAIDHSAIFPQKRVQKYCFFLKYANYLIQKCIILRKSVFFFARMEKN